MEPIINPWLVYLYLKIETISSIFFVLGLSIVIFIVGRLIFYIGAYEWDDITEKEFRVKTKNYSTKIIVGIIICCLSSMFPTQKDILILGASTQITTDNIEKAVDISTVIGESIKEATRESLEYVKDSIIEIKESE